MSNDESRLRVDAFLRQMERRLEIERRSKNTEAIARRAKFRIIIGGKFLDGRNDQCSPSKIK